MRDDDLVEAWQAFVVLVVGTVVWRGFLAIDTQGRPWAGRALVLVVTWAAVLAMMGAVLTLGVRGWRRLARDREVDERWLVEVVDPAAMRSSLHAFTVLRAAGIEDDAAIDAYEHRHANITSGPLSRRQAERVVRAAEKYGTTAHLRSAADPGRREDWPT